jgi:hypothetical protein
MQFLPFLASLAAKSKFYFNAVKWTISLNFRWFCLPSRCFHFAVFYGDKFLFKNQIHTRR